MTRRPIARFVTGLGLLVLGAVAVVRIPLMYTPRTSFPALTVVVQLADDTDVADITERWVVPVESEIRAMGAVRGMRGQVGSSSAWITVLLDPGVDPEVKTARLLSGLRSLRKSMPPGATLDAWPAVEANDDLLAVLWIDAPVEAAVERDITERLRGVRGVREVQRFGAPTLETVIHLTGDISREGVERRIRDSLRVARLGQARVGSRTLPVVDVGKPIEEVGRLPLRLGSAVVPLEGLARIERRSARPRQVARYNGRAGVALLVFRDDEASPLAVDRAVRSVVDRPTIEGKRRLHLIRSEVEPLRRLVVQLIVGLVVMSAGLGVAGWAAVGRWAGARLAVAPWLALAAAINALWLTGFELDLLTLLALALAVVVVAPLAVTRVAVRGLRATGWVLSQVLAAGLLPVAIYVSGSELAPVLARPAAAFFVSVLGAAPTVLLLESGFVRRRSLRIGRWLRRWTRMPATILLFTVTLLAGLLTLFGESLRLTEGSLLPDRSRLGARVSLPEGATLEETERQVRRFEEVLKGFPEIKTSTSLISAGSGRIRMDVRRESRAPARLARLATRLSYRVPRGLATIQPAHREGVLGRASALLLADEIEDRAETDEDAWSYRVILRGVRLRSIRGAYEDLRSRIVAQGVPQGEVIADWGAPSTRIELEPGRETLPGEAHELAAGLRARSTEPPRLPVPGAVEHSVTVRTSSSPRNENDVPRSLELLHAPISIGGAEAIVPAVRVRPRERAVFPSVMRQSGRFVLPVTVAISHHHPDVRRQTRENIDRSLGGMTLPSGVDLERPSLQGRKWTPTRLRMIALAAVIPLLLFAVAAVYTGSLSAALGALLPTVVGLAAATPLLWAGAGQLDEITLFALIAALCGTLPLSLRFCATALERLRRTDPVPAVYRTLREGGVALAIGTLAPILGLGLPSIVGDPSGDVWLGALRLAGVTSAAVAGAAGLLLPPVFLFVIEASRRDRREEARRRRPPAWRESAALPHLAVRSLTKVYPGGVRALSAVDFEVGSGIIGLLGPNGAGKTTLLRLLTGLLEPSRGMVSFRGVRVGPENLEELRRHVGFLPQDFSTYATVTAAEFLEHWAWERGFADRGERKRRVRRLLETVGLDGEADRKVADFSGGMRRRVGIALALLPDPDVLIVDEPTTGLDIESRVAFRDTLLHVAERKIILFSTHIASDVEAVATRLIVIHRGRIRFDGPPSRLVERARGRVIERVIDDTQLVSFADECRVSTRVRVLEGIRVRAVLPRGESVPEDAVEPTLEEAYLAEIDDADRVAGSTRRTGRFAFLDRAEREPWL